MLTAIAVKDLHHGTQDTPHRYRGEGFDELVASIKEVGIQQPPKVRLSKKGKATYEIIFGHRRTEAAKAAGLETIEVDLVKADDQLVDQLRLVENMIREDATPMEEAALVARLLERSDGDAKAVAAVLGWPTSKVHRRAQLTQLSESWQKVLAGDHGSNITAGHLEIIARLPHEAQDEILERCWGYPRGREKGRLVHFDSAKAFAKQVHEDHLADLAKAKWPLDQAITDLGLPACEGCPHRGDTQTELFADLAGKKKGEVKCLRAECFEKKRTWWSQKNINDARAKHGSTLPLVTPRGHGHVDIQGAKVLSCYEYKTAKKGDKGAVPAIIAGGGNAGKITYIKTSAENARKAASGKATITDPERLDKLKKKRTKAIATRLEKDLAKVEKLPCSFKTTVAGLVAFGCARETYEGMTWKGDKVLAALKDLERGAWVQLRDQLRKRLTYLGHYGSAQDLEEVETLAATFNLVGQYQKIVDEIVLEIPLPKLMRDTWVDGIAPTKKPGAKQAKAKQTTGKKTSGKPATAKRPAKKTTKKKAATK